MQENDMPKIVDHDQYREELIQKCFELFSKKGYSNVTMREIAKQLKVSTGSLYHYFPTKQSIFEHMFDIVGKQDVQEAIDKINQVTTIEDKLGRFCQYMEDRLEFYQNLLLLTIDFYRSQPQKQSQDIVKTFSDFVKNRIFTNLEIPEKYGRTLLVWLIGIVYHSLLTPDLISLREEIEKIKELLLIFTKHFDNRLICEAS
jgi:AcrR family transcriptional regulator